MKTIVKIEIVILILLVIAAAGLRLAIGSGLIDLSPELIERTPEPIPQDAPEQVQEVPAPVQAEVAALDVPLELAAERYFAYDVREGEYLLTQGDVHEKLYPASITKLLTSYVVLQYLDPSIYVTVDGGALALVEEDSSVAGLEAGDTLTVEQLIAAMMLPSGNDAAQVAAVETGRIIAGDSSLDGETARKTFVDEMNVQAALLGMENSHFENPDGWHHEEHYTTMHDLVLLSQKVLKNQTILKYTSCSEDTIWLGDRELEWTNTNFLLHEGGETYVPSTIGLKTGYTSNAGGCLMSAFFDKDRLILIGVFGGPGFTMDRYLDTVAIYNSL